MIYKKFPDELHNKNNNFQKIQNNCLHSLRNKEYLRMTYGFDYKALSGKYDELLKNKSITRKIKTSIKEWELGKELLKIPMDSISLQNSEWLSLVYSLMNEQKSEKELDPRL